MIGVATECVKCGVPLQSCILPAYCIGCDPVYAEISARNARVAAKALGIQEDTVPKVSDEEAYAIAERIAVANEYMVGGNHYRDRPGEQHWDRQWRLFGPGYFVGCATKYLERYEKKGGLNDLRKAVHFTQKLLELETAYAKGEGPVPGNGRAPLECKEGE